MLALAMRREHMTGRSNYEPANPLAGFEHLQHNSGGNPFAVVPSSEGRVRETRPEAEVTATADVSPRLEKEKLAGLRDELSYELASVSRPSRLDDPVVRSSSPGNKRRLLIFE
ncbi:hypothetical protein EAI_06717 [Harpegnathos saltator]|uniref:Uncharacterized protein n=1 Tax=Harpegnathos saltator TaxID=610380 RepID=E2BL41_HARSA|nr:hypothetical protein EAI_06717 [Harpegnathos saltator]